MLVEPLLTWSTEPNTSAQNIGLLVEHVKVYVKPLNSVVGQPIMEFGLGGMKDTQWASVQGR